MPLPRRTRSLTLAALCCLALAGCSATATAKADPPTHTSTSPTSASSTAQPPPTTSSAPVSVVGVGDSVTAGTNCGCTDFVTQYANGLRNTSGHATVATNLGSNGATTTTVADALAGDPATRRAVAGAGVVLVTIGANDLVPLIKTWQSHGCGHACYQPAVTAMGTRLDTVLGDIQRLRSSRPTLVLVTDYWNVFEDGQVAVSDYGHSFAPWSDTVTRAANTAIESSARTADDTFVDLYVPFKGDGDRDDTDLLASDGDHPDAAGTALIATVLLAATPEAVTKTGGPVAG